MNKYTKYEKDIIKFYERDEWQPVPEFEKEREKYFEYAKSTCLKNKRINIRISERDLKRLKSKSIEEGIPYQTLIVSILHKYSSGKLIEQN